MQPKILAITIVLSYSCMKLGESFEMDLFSLFFIALFSLDSVLEFGRFLNNGNTDKSQPEVVQYLLSLMVYVAIFVGTIVRIIRLY